MMLAVRWVAVTWAGIAVAAGCFAQQDVAQQIGQISSPGRAEALGAKLLQQSREAAAAAAALWQTGDPAVRKNARIVLNEMEEAALDPLLKAKGNLEPAEQIWRMTMVVETVGDLRKSAAVLVDRQLDNQQAAPRASIPGAEERSPARRVCDEAYVLMSRLTAADPQSEAFLLRMTQFNRMLPAVRDAEIRRVRQSMVWRTLIQSRGN